MLAFTPIILLPGGPGDFVSAIGESVIIAVAWSFLLAMTVTPALAGIFSRPTPRGARRRFWRDGVGFAPLLRLYRRALGQALHRPVAVVAVALFLPLSGFLLLPSMGQSFMPPSDRDMFEVRVWMPRTRPSAARTYRRVRSSASSASRRRWPASPGSSAPTSPASTTTSRWTRTGRRTSRTRSSSTESNEATKRVLAGLQSELDERFPAAQILVRQFRQGPPVVADVEYRIIGPSVPLLIDLGERVRRTLQSDPEVVITQATMTRGEPKLWLAADEDRARIAGLSLESVASSCRPASRGGWAER